VLLEGNARLANAAIKRPRRTFREEEGDSMKTLRIIAIAATTRYAVNGKSWERPTI
jgi:hypothetical protein